MVVDEAVMAAVEVAIMVVVAVEEIEIVEIVTGTETIPEDHADLGQDPDRVQEVVQGGVIPNLGVDQKAAVVAEVAAGATKASLNQNQDQDLRSKIPDWNCVFELLLNISNDLLTSKSFINLFDFICYQEQ